MFRIAAGDRVRRAIGRDILDVGHKKSPHKCGQKYWKQCEQCRTEYLSCLLNYSVMRKIIFLI
ncbi:hypothetical protein DK853_18390 [Klebsiella oxytoca]|nr:hypothetical protein [Klebsiella oxytoca]MBZ7200059.1 hypothetical protein [Klebsiella oxytoca]MBZ7739146.1 hypothetical protein [Klebsiella oxytoca]RAZ97574.1 hypothetical protein DK853_18390 [Klebsiella oxytoca]